MKRSVLEYAAVDQYILLALTSEVMPAYRGGVRAIPRAAFDPDIVESCTTDLGIPDQIIIQDFEFNLSDEGELDGRGSIKAGSFRLQWYDEHPETGNPTNHRDSGPAFIEFGDYATHHDNGQRIGFSINRWEFRWVDMGMLKRAAGPFTVTGDKTECLIDQAGDIRYTTEPRLTTRWNHPGGGAITESQIQTVIAKNQIRLNRLAIGDSVFETPADEVFFYGDMKE